jgi:hypothetical protein
MKWREMRWLFKAPRIAMFLAFPSRQIMPPSLRQHVTPAIGECLGCTFATGDTTVSFGPIWATVRKGHDDSCWSTADNRPIYGLTAAKEALEINRHEHRQNKLPTAGRKPLLADYCET